MYRSVNPYTAEKLDQFPFVTEEDINTILERLDSFWRNQWGKLSVKERCDLLASIPELLAKKKNILAQLVSLEMGKPITQSRAEVEKCISLCKYYLQNAQTYLQPKIRHSDSKKGYVYSESLGIVLGVMPWNFPIWQVFRFAFPSLIAGNVVLLKPAFEVPATSLALESLFSDYSIFRVALADHSLTSKLILDHRVQALTFTGSTQSGIFLAQIAGQRPIPVVMELGGSDPYMVMEDADIEIAANILLYARCQNNGQTCIAAKRWIIHESLYQNLIENIIYKAKNLQWGDPLDENTQMTCLASERMFEINKQLLSLADHSNHEVIWLDKGLSEYHPLAIPPGMICTSPDWSVWRDKEIFSPVALACTFKHPDEAVAAANNSPFGLGAGVITQDESLFMNLATRIKAGNVVHNQFLSSDPAFPFGGIHSSGYGRELGEEGLLNFTNQKTILLS